ncbi:FtsX-like permease family protein [Flexivirga sp. B27]
MVLLIGLPLLLVSGAATFAFTKDVNGAEGISRTMGSSQALLTNAGEFGNGVVTQSADARSWSGGAGARSALHFDGRPKTPDATDIQQVTGGSVLPVTERVRRVQVGDRRLQAAFLGIDGRQRAYAGMATLTSGHWPTNTHQALVSRSGAGHGIPTGGTLTVVGPDGRSTKLTVVGRVETPNAQDVVTLPRAGASTWLLERSAPVQWPEVKHLNRYGLAVASRAVIHDPGQAESDPSTDGMGYTAVPPVVWVLLGVGLVIVIAMLAGPAFAASGARHRRALAQLASNGATKQQLRKYVLAQALLLGALAALLSIVLGAVLGAAAAKLYGHWSATSATPGPVELRWGWGILLFAVAVVAALIAAFIPAVAAARVNLIAVLRGHVSAAKVRAGWPLLGLLLAVAGGVILTVTLVGSGINAQRLSLPLLAGTIVGTVALFAGTLMTAPWLLSRLGMLARHLPLAFRIAARDVGRQRGRAVATVGAILATVAALTTLSIAFATSARANAEAYQPSLRAGDGLVSVMTGGTKEADVAAKVVRSAIPDATVMPLRTLRAKATDASVGALLAGSPEQLAHVFRLDARDVAALRDGDVLLSKDVPGSSAGTLRLTARGKDEAKAGSVTVSTQRSAQRHFRTVPTKPDAYSSFGSGVEAGALVSTRAARPIPGGSVVRQVIVRVPGGISDTDERAVNERLDANSFLYVERGPDTAGAWLYWLIAGVFGLLVLVATLTSTALSNAESRPDSATFASLGAPASLRRRIAGANAAVVGFFGALLGLAVGAVAGVAVSHPVSLVTNQNSHHTVTAIPWTPLLVVVIGVPLLAAALAAVVTRGRVPMTRRVT